MDAEALGTQTSAEALPEAATAFLAKFNAWALKLTKEDFIQVAPILQTLMAAHVEKTPE